MDRSKVVAVITGAIAILLSVAYLLLVQLLDWRGEMIPAPVDLSALPLSHSSPVEQAVSFAGWAGGRLS